MPDSVFYNVTQEPLFSEKGKYLKNIVATPDLKIIRLFLEKNSNHYVTSKIIFLNKPTFNDWMTNVKNKLIDKHNSVGFKKDRFISGLDMFDAYVRNIDLDIDSISAITKIRNFIINSEPTLKQLQDFTEKSILTMKGIMFPSGSVEDNVFNNKTGFYFLPPIIENYLTDYVYIEVDGLDKLDSTFTAPFRQILVPENKNTDTTLISDKTAKALLEMKNPETLFREYVDKKVAILKQALKTHPDLLRIKNEIIIQTQNQTPTTLILKSLEDRTSICTECKTETTTRYCENITCKTNNPISAQYSIPDFNIQNLIESKVSFVLPSRELSEVDNSTKSIAIKLYANEYIKNITEYLDTNKVSIGLNVNKLNSENGIRTAILETNDEIIGEKIEFWDYFEFNNLIYAIIQSHDEIKTPSLLKEAKQKLEQQGREISLEINEDFFINEVTYVITDKYGQIIKVREGRIDTSNPKNILLSTSLDKYSEIISLSTPYINPYIGDILFIKNAKSTPFRSKKGRHLRSLLNVDDYTSDEISNFSNDYSERRGKYYRLSEGNFIYESNFALIEVSIDSKHKVLGNGTIDKISYVIIKDTIRDIDLKNQKAQLYKQYFRDLLFSPNKSSKIFFENYQKDTNKSFEKSQPMLLKNAGILDILFNGEDYNILKTRVYRSHSQITKSSTRPIIEYSKLEFQAFSIIKVTPFLLKELSYQKIIKKMSFLILNSQNSDRHSTISDLSTTKTSYNQRISNFTPTYTKLYTDTIVKKQLLSNILQSIGTEVCFTVSLDITLQEGTTDYEITLLKEYLSENGICIIKKTNNVSPISIYSGDLISILF